MRFSIAFVLGILAFMSSAFAHPGHIDHMISPSIWHVISDPMHLLFLAGVVGVGFVVGYFALKIRG
ncbi:MAG: hypothetical protein ACRBBN_07250 [Methyloligellaceae bacterium]